MTDAKHTATPWHTRGDGYVRSIGGGTVAHCGDETYHGCGNPEVADANAKLIEACVNACAGMADPAAEIAELRAENDRLRRYVGDEMIRSDFKTAAQMRSQLEHYRNEVIALRRNEAEAIDAIKAVGYTTPHGESDSLGEAVVWLVAEAERLRARVRELEEAARGICTAFTEDIDGNLRFGGREIVTQAVRAVCKAYRKERAS